MEIEDVRKAVNNLTRAANDARMALRESAMLADCVADAVERGEDVGHALQNLQACALRANEAYGIARETTCHMISEGEKIGRVKFIITEQMKRDAMEAMTLYGLAQRLAELGKIPNHHIHDDSPWRTWWRCRKGHKWREAVADHNRRGKCPFCVLWEKT